MATTSLSSSPRTPLWLFVLVGLLAVGGLLSGTLVMLHTRSTLAELSEQYFEEGSRAMSREVRDLLSPAEPVLQECLRLAQRGLLPVNDPDRLGDALVERLRSDPRLGWLSYSDHATGTYVGAKRLPDGSVALNRSSPVVNGGLPAEFLVYPNGVRIPHPIDVKDPYDPRTRPFYKLATGREGIVWTEPYTFHEGSVGITATVALRDETRRNIQGVFTADFFLDAISRSMKAYVESHAPGGFHFVIDTDGVPVASSMAFDRQKTPAVLFAALGALPDALPDLKPGMTKAYTFEHAGKTYRAAIEIFNVSKDLEWGTVCLLPDNGSSMGLLREAGALALVPLVLLVLALGLGGWLALRGRHDGANEGPPPEPVRISTTAGTTPGRPISTLAQAPPEGLAGITAELPSPAGKPPTSVGGTPDGGAFILEGQSLVKDGDTTRLVRSIKLSRSIEDLRNEGLLAAATRVAIEDREVPMLKGIPLLAKLGKGAMGSVYYGVHPRLRREVAVKVLSNWAVQKHPKLVERFVQEAQMGAQVQSPFLVGVYDVDEIRGSYFQVMEYVRGVSADDLLRGLEPHDGHEGLDEDDALDLIIAASKGLAAAHAHGIVHRDLKPDNILVPFRDGTEKPNYKAAKLADLGIARSETNNLSLTETFSAIGTPGFLAPEQARDAKNVGKAADVFGMGATLFALLTGHPPFQGPTPIATLLQTLENDPESIRKARPDLSEPTIQVIERCLLKESGDRYADAEALGKALAEARAKLG